MPINFKQCTLLFTAPTPLNLIIRSLVFILSCLSLIELSHSKPVDLGLGGVFNSHQANIYWDGRFGYDFFYKLILMQNEINISTASMFSNAKDVFFNTMFDPKVI